MARGRAWRRFREEVREQAEFRKSRNRQTSFWLPSFYLKRVAPDQQITVAVNSREDVIEREQHQAKVYRNLRTPCSCGMCATPRNSILHKPSAHYPVSDVRRMTAADYELSSFGGRDEN